MIRVKRTVGVERGIGLECRFCGRETAKRGHEPWCERPRIVQARMHNNYEGSGNLSLILTENQVANLKWLMKVAEPVANTGDWYHELLEKLDHVETDDHPTSWEEDLFLDLDQYG